jgi:transcriptional regulator with GAF, ATPase, and Fis domain
MVEEPSDLEKTVSRGAQRAGTSKPRDAVIHVVYPPGLEYVVRLKEERVVIGRAPPDGAPALAHDTVSRAHFAAAWDGVQRCHVGTDLGSHNGSRVDGCTVPANTRHCLQNGSVIQFGDVLAVYERGRGVGVGESTSVSEDEIPGMAAPVRLRRAAIERAAPDPSPVLLVGETGTGKELIARAIHRLSARAGEMIAVNCAALSPQLIESELFGHVKGAFTGATAPHEGWFRAAHGGSLFLDEIGELPPELQPKLLRVLQDGEVQPLGSTVAHSVDVRIIAATNRDLSQSMERGDFRRDLYARLALWELRVPPLRERRVDLLMWLERLHRRWLEMRHEDRTEPLSFSPEAAETILLNLWPDNLRGLDRLIHELASTRSDAQPIGREHMPAWLREGSSTIDEPAHTPRIPDAGPSPERRAAPTRDEFVVVMEQLDGNVRAMAKHFGRDRRQIYRWIEAYGLTERRHGKRDD